MQSIRVISKSRQGLARVLQNPSPILPSSSVLDELAPDCTPGFSCSCCCSSPMRRRFHSAAFFSGVASPGSYSRVAFNSLKNVMLMMRQIRLFSSEETVVEHHSEDSAKEVYDKVLHSVEKLRSAPPKKLLKSLFAKCSTPEDIDLLFAILKRLRIFRLSNLRIAENYKPWVHREVTMACVRSGAIDFAKLALRKHNLIGLTPDIWSANHLLLHAKQHSDVELMNDIMKLMKKNELPLKHVTADIVFSICSSTDRWDLMTEYGKLFSFDIWMEFAVKRGDVESLWKIEKWRSEALENHSLSTGFSCAKGFLLDHKPESAAAIIQELNQSLSDVERESIAVELQKLASEWPSKLMKHQEDDNKKAFAAALQNDICAMINSLPSLGVEVNVEMEDLSNLV